VAKLIIVSKKDRKKAVTLYKKGVGGIGVVAKLLGVSLGKARRVLIEEGVEIRTRGRPKKVVKTKTKTKTKAKSKKTSEVPVEAAAEDAAE